MQCTLLSLGGKVKDAHISLLINAGLLVCKQLYHSFIHSLSLFVTLDTIFVSQTRQLIDPDMYWFTIPSIGKLLKALRQVTS